MSVVCHEHNDGAVASFISPMHALQRFTQRCTLEPQLATPIKNEATITVQSAGNASGQGATGLKAMRVLSIYILIC